jgi:hypothetical chaperone protein
MRKAIGLDFGTTNSAIGIRMTDGSIGLAQFHDGDYLSSTFKSILYFHPVRKGERGSPVPVTGPEAIAQYFEAEVKGRLLQSIKSFLPSQLFTNTRIYNRSYKLEELICFIIKDLRNIAIEQFGDIGDSVVLGRPVKFAGADSDEDEKFALDRLKSAAEMAGFKNISFEFEPIAAAYEYERQLDRDELVLIGDFGGGTSDFTLIRLGPDRAHKESRNDDILGTTGVAVAGNNFDGKIMRRVVAPKLGLGSHYVSMGTEMSVPAWLYTNLEEWHHVSFLKAPQTIKVIRDVQAQAIETGKLEALLHIVNNDLGYNLHRAVERTKIALSEREVATFTYRDWYLEIEEEVTRTQFETWIDADVEMISRSIDLLLSNCGVSRSDVDSVFLTGGSSFVPKVRRLFAGKFGLDRLRSGEEMTSVAKGLALCAASNQ